MSCLVLALVLLPSLAGLANAGPPGSAFGVNYDGSIGSGSFLSWMMANDAAYYLNGPLYDGTWYAATAYNNNSASSAYANLPNIAVWHFGRHANAGLVAFFKETSPGNWIKQKIEANPYVANSPSDPYLDGAIYYLNNLTGSSLDDVLLVTFLGCNTANYKTNHYGDQKYNLLFLLRNEKLVSNVIGSQGLLYDLQTTDWSGIFYYRGTSGNRTIQQALNYATNEIYVRWGNNYYGTDKIVAVGNALTDKMWPARWGPPGL